MPSVNRPQSVIFDDGYDADPYLKYAKNNILIILACFTTYNIYYLFRDYQDAIILGVLAGVAYKELDRRFVDIWNRRTYQRTNKKISIINTLFYLILLFILPWIRNQTKNNFDSINLSLESVWLSFLLTTNPVVRVAQIYLFIQLLYSVASNKFIEWFTFQDMSKNIRWFFSGIFSIITAIAVLLTIGTFAVVITTEFGRAYSLTKTSIEKFYSCEFEPSSHNSTIIPCGQMISGNISAYMPKIQNDAQYYLCINSINSTEINYLGYDYFDYEDDICTFKQYVKYISPNLIQSISLKETGLLLSSLKNVIFTVVNFALDTSFSISTFFAIFMVVIYDVDNNKSRLNELFGSSKEHLVKDITNLVSATVFIALEHLGLGIFVFQILRFTEINIILSLFLSVIAFIPLIKPSLIVFMIAALKIWLGGNQITSIACALLYWYFSGQIYHKYYKNVSLNTVIINLSVIFGIYQYGVSGIFYGPLLILLFQCVHAELFQIKNKQIDKKFLSQILFEGTDKK